MPQATVSNGYQVHEVQSAGFRFKILKLLLKVSAKNNNNNKKTETPKIFGNIDPPVLLSTTTLLAPFVLSDVVFTWLHPSKYLITFFPCE
jgi:hypothetical protein